MNAVYLIGMRGAGKSTLGRIVGAKLGVEFIDIDAALEAKFGKTILGFVNENGMEAFRDEEFRYLQGLEKRGFSKGTLIAPGGGVVEKRESRELLQTSPFPKIYLSFPAHVLWQRLESYPDRCQIGGLKSESDFLRLFHLREPHFLALATHVLTPSPAQAAAALDLENHCRKLF